MDVTDTEQIHSVVLPADEPPPKPRGKHGGYRPTNPGGRPRKIPKPEDGAAPARVKKSDLVLPLLPHGRNCKISEAIEWWHALTEDQLKHIVVYFYRTWPAWDAKKFDDKNPKNIEIVAGACPYSVDNFERDFMTKHGCGDYYFSINEDSIHRWDIYFKTTRDFDNYPPVFDHRLLVMDDPANKSYITWARGHGRLNDIDAPETENDMASNAALERMADTTDRLTDKVIDLADRATQRPESTSVESQVQLKIVEQMNEASTKAIDTVINIMDRQAANKDKQSDPLEMVDRVISLTNSLRGGGDDKVTALMQTMMEESRRRSERLEEELREIRRERRNPDGGEGDGGERPRGLLGRLQEHLENKLIESLEGKATGENGSGAEQQAGGEKKTSSSFKEMLMDQAFKQLPQMIGPGGLVGLLQSGAALFQAARGQAPAGGATAQQPQPAINPAAAPAPAPLPNNGFPPPASTGNAIMDELITTTWQMAPTLLFHLHSEDRNGYTFARWLIDSSANGRQNYNYMKEAGMDDLLKMIELYPPLDEALKKTPEKRNAFITEMLRLDEWEKEQAELDDEGDEEELPVAAGATK